jgi:hypothetical protein
MSQNINPEERERIEQFQLAFNKIEGYLRDQLRATDQLSFSELVRQYGRDNPNWEHQFSQELRSFASLRNALAHQSYGNHRYLSVPVPTVVERIIYIQQQTINELRVIPHFQRDVVTIRAEDSLMQVLG